MKKLFVFMSIVFFSPYYFAFANFQINEIMYDLKTGGDDGREWVEIYNDSDQSVDLSSYRFFEADTNHKIKLVQGSPNIEAYGYALLVSNSEKFKIDWFIPPSSGGTSFSGTIFDSSFSLSNDGEVLAIKDKDQNVADQFFYSSSMGGAGDGKSLQKINGVWQGAKPTPGMENKISYVPPVLPKSAPVIKQVSFEPKKPDEVVVQEVVKDQAKPLENLEASVINTDTEGNTEESSNSYIFIIIFILLLCISSGAVYFIRKNRTTKEPGSDFKILEE